MEQHENQKRKTYRRRKQSKSSLSFPIDLTSEILLRLPEKSVGRFRCVSKRWSSITTDPYFINLFESSRPSLLLCIKKDDELFVSSIPQHALHQNSNKCFSSSQPIDRYHSKFPEEYNGFSPTESVHGLICFQESGKPVVWNLSKRQFLTLPKPRERAGMIYNDPVEGKHKVVCMPLDRSCDECLVLTIGSTQESRRTVKTNHQHRSDSSGRCIKGVIYIIKNGRRLWILEVAAKNKWSSQDLLLPFDDHFDESLGTYFSLKGITHAGELIYLPNGIYKWFSILFFDPVRNSYRRFEHKGISDDEPSVYELHAFPNLRRRT